MRGAVFLALLILGACAAPGGPYPSLQPRAAEGIDPRVPVVRPINDRPVTAALASRLAALVDQARSGDAAFSGAASEAERLAATAGAPQSEGWIAAQEALTAAIAARTPTATALGDIDALGGNVRKPRSVRSTHGNRRAWMRSRSGWVFSRRSIARHRARGR